MPPDERLLSPSDAYEAAYRFVWQYAAREPDSVSLQLMLVAMQPASDGYRTDDPASWEDWLECVEAVGRDPLPAFPRTPPGK